MSSGADARRAAQIAGCIELAKSGERVTYVARSRDHANALVNSRLLKREGGVVRSEFRRVEFPRAHALAAVEFVGVADLGNWTGLAMSRSHKPHLAVDHSVFATKERLLLRGLRMRAEIPNLIWFKNSDAIAEWLADITARDQRVSAALANMEGRT